MTKSAVISPDGVYRYHLQRIWDEFLPRVGWIMLNPSTADADLDDPTIRRCIRFSKDWGFGGLDVVNLFALRATDPTELRKAKDPIGPHNSTWIQKIVTSPDVVMVVAAWGAHGHFHFQGQEYTVRQMLKSMGVKLHSVGPRSVSGPGFPKHPLYLHSSLKPEVYA